ncbi:hypothetical protein [Candidatus Halocynthiibacter alkanivorans]|uniref:hypothetical protein n=1 Tax=Candidatus Halocynthiibacter alkanivorans TaxID=2267619 RepID=UPI00109C095B|nr:hypothetical protein [Candidatus Halocynthiibacter alkanivorans]
MNLAIQATKYMVWLQSVLIVVFSALGIWDNDKELFSIALVSSASAIFLYLVLIGLRRELFWVAVPFAAFCVIDFIGALGSGLSFRISVDLVDAVLSFVAVCGIVIWLSERGSLNNEDQKKRLNAEADI